MPRPQLMRVLMVACGRMPEISRSFGILIRMYFDDHNPPHFPPIYAGNEAEVAIEPIETLEGRLPARAASMVFEWAALHQRELVRNWHRLHNEQPAERIRPLE